MILNTGERGPSAMFGKREKEYEKGLDAETTPLSIDRLSDDMLITAIINGSIWAIEKLYERYHHALYVLAYRMVTDHQIAEDLLQETFLAVWRSASTYSARIGSVRSWLFSIIHHQTIDYLRSAQRRSPLNRISLEEIEQDALLSDSDVWDDVWRAAQGMQIRAALLKLPKEQQMVITMAYFQGWTHTEIAEMCRLPLGTVKGRIRLGLQHLRQLLAQMGVEGI
jgi:RNA polymerase sigma factor (sigma-70 family)